MKLQIPIIYNVLNYHVLNYPTSLIEAYLLHIRQWSPVFIQHQQTLGQTTQIQKPIFNSIVEIRFYITASLDWHTYIYIYAVTRPIIALIVLLSAPAALCCPPVCIYTLTHSFAIVPVACVCVCVCSVLCSVLCSVAADKHADQARVSGAFVCMSDRTCVYRMCAPVMTVWFFCVCVSFKTILLLAR